MNAVIESSIKLSLTRSFDADPATVFDAWLQKSWGEWVGPAGVNGEVIQLEPRVGGRYRIVMHLPDGGTLTVGGTYKEIARPSKIVMSWKWEHESQDTLITLTFAAEGRGTAMTIHHQGFAAPERRDSHNKGWTGTLEKLAAYLARTP
jgi:uncharacterized protein YndB with AHSA1/START domain